MRGSPTPRLLAGLAATLLAVGVFSWYTLSQIEGLRTLQTNTVDRNRRDSLQLLRIQNDLNSLGLAIRDMVEGQQEYPLTAFRSEFERIRNDLNDALRIERTLSNRPPEQNQFLEQSMRQFWDSVEQVLKIAEADETRARRILANSVTAQQASLSSSVARLLVQNHEAEEQAIVRVAAIYDGVERNIYVFLVAMLTGIAAIGVFMVVSNRKVFERLAQLSDQRSTLSRRLIGLQEEVFRSVSRELHDDFGQILTAIGTMLRRAEKKGLPPDSSFREEVSEVREVVQETLEKTRSFSQALHPTILDDYGLEKAIERHLQTFEKQSGISTRFEKQGAPAVDEAHGIHIYRVVQEALNNIAKHANARTATVRLRVLEGQLVVDIEDDGVGIAGVPKTGLGLIAMRERAELVGGALTVGRTAGAGTLVRLRAPLTAAPH
ncbi:MAG TPA: sensor histidine kinase [Bryobacteraceae bacterium]|nr:sensor histidine kinase [Bryobacteraceae bacterium]